MKARCRSRDRLRQRNLTRVLIMSRSYSPTFLCSPMSLPTGFSARVLAPKDLSACRPWETNQQSIIQPVSADFSSAEEVVCHEGAGLSLFDPFPRVPPLVPRYSIRRLKFCQILIKHRSRNVDHTEQNGPAAVPRPFQSLSL